MAKIITFLLLAFTFSAALCTTFTKSQVREIVAAGRECVRKLKIPIESDIVERVLYNRDVVKDEETFKYFECGCTKLGWLDSEGNIGMASMVEFLSRSVPRKTAEDVLEKCRASFQGDYVGEKMFNFHQCFFGQQ